MFDCRKWIGVTLTLGFTAALLLGLASSSLAKPPPPPPPTYEYTIKLLPMLPGATWMDFKAMNNLGDIVGNASLAGGGGVGFLYVAGTGALVDLDSLILANPPSISFSDDVERTVVGIAIESTSGINDIGQITGWLTIKEPDDTTPEPEDTIDTNYAFRYTPSTVTLGAPTLECLGTISFGGIVDDSSGDSGTITYGWVSVQSINNLGDVSATAALGAYSADPRKIPNDCGVIWPYASPKAPELIRATAPSALFSDFQKSVTGNANAINDQQQVVGKMGTSPVRAFRYDFPTGTMTTYLPVGPGSPTQAVIVDNDNEGDMVGVTSVSTSTLNRACQVVGGGLVSLGTLDNSASSESSAQGVSRPTSTGVPTIVGYSSLLVGGKRGAYEHRAFVYTEAKGMRDLFPLVDRNAAGYPVGLKAADLNSVPKINNLGQIAGTIAGSQYQGTSGLYSGRVWIVTPKP